MIFVKQTKERKYGFLMKYPGRKDKLVRKVGNSKGNIDGKLTNNAQSYIIN